MNEIETDALMDQLFRLLERERRALLAGDLVEMPKIAEAKQALVEALDQFPPADETALQMLQEKVRHNQVLLDGTLQGIRQVAARLANLRRLRRTLETYDAEGRKQVIETGGDHRMEKRA